MPTAARYQNDQTNDIDHLGRVDGSSIESYELLINTQFLGFNTYTTEIF